LNKILAPIHPPFGFNFQASAWVTPQKRGAAATTMGNPEVDPPTPGQWRLARFLHIHVFNGHG
jgi:hypothetical protein